MTTAIARADRLLRAGRRAEARREIAVLTGLAPGRVESWLLLARLEQGEGDFAAMLQAARQATDRAPGDPVAVLTLIEAEVMNGDTAEARSRLAGLRAERTGDPVMLRRIAEAYTHLGAHAEADGCVQAALALRPEDPDLQHEAASCALAMGRLAEAEALLDAVLARRPDDFDACYNRATLRRQTPEHNHVDALEAALARVGEAPAPALHYALSKELEDLGQTDRAFDHLERGAAARRAMMAYDVAGDVAAMRDIGTAFDAGFLASDAPGYEDEAPIFVVGLPRSGTTLVDRILSRHPRVESRGEMNDLPLAVMRAAGKCADKRERIGRVAQADMAELGRSYCRSVRGAGAAGAVFVDKTPLNFLYLGVIARALPRARIVHLTRHPMAGGHAMLKTLFRMGYPFSYSQADLARYQGAYLALMEHWRAHLGERMLDVAYEDIVDHQERETRRLLAHCGLDWRDECLAFNEASGPSATASAAQVRRPLYRDSRDQWRGVAHRLTVLADGLRAAGVDVS